MKKTLILLSVLFITSCVKDAQSTVSYGEFKVEFLFEKDGCKIYRFKDGGSYIYWSNCSGRISSEVYHHQGKTGYTEHKQSFTSANP